MATQLIRYHKRKLVDGRIDLFYWFWVGADVIGWFGANERLGNVARFGAAEPTIQDQDEQLNSIRRPRTGMTVQEVFVKVRNIISHLVIHGPQVGQPPRD